MELTANRLIEIVQSIHSNCVNQWPLHEPSLTLLEKQRVDECLNSGYVSSVGKFVVQFEQAIQKFTGARYAIATVNGTSALHVAYLLAGVQPNDEVLTSPLSFIATSNAIRYCQAYPHFVDIEPDSFSIDAEKLRCYLHKNVDYVNGFSKNRQTGRIIRALALVHILGHPANIQDLKAVCNEFNLELIEDAAEGLGSTYREQHVGTFGKAGILSFNGNKIITCGAGGMLLTNDEALAQRARHLTTTAKVAHPWESTHDEIGFNYRMPNLNAALGMAQMERLPLLLSYKRQLATIYANAFDAYRNITFVKEPQDCRSNYWLNAILVNNKNTLHDLLFEASANNIGVRPLWNLHHTLPIFFDCPRMPISVATDIVDRILCLPSSAHTFKLNEVSQTCAG